MPRSGRRTLERAPEMFRVVRQQRLRSSCLKDAMMNG